MALTRVSRHIIDDPFNPTAVSATDVTTTNINASGIGTVGTLRVTGDLTVEGTTTTLDSILTEVDRLEVSANSTVAAGIITQTGSGDILNLFDGSTEVFSVTDGGKVKIGTETEGDSSADNLTIADSGNSGITIRSGTSNQGSIFFSDATSGSGEYDGFIQYSQNDQWLKFGTATSTRLTISSAGYVGINETTPSNRLHVKETNSNTIVGKIESSVAYSYLSIEDNSTTTGNVRVGAHGNDLVMNAGAVQRLRITSDGKVRVPDNGKFVAGDGDDLQIYHDGSHSYVLDNGTGDLRLASNSTTRITKGDSETCAAFNVDGASELYYDNSKKLETASTGIQVTGQVNASTMHLTDGNGIHIGNSNDLRIFHDGSQNAINSYTSNPFNIISNGNTTIKSNNNDNMAVFKKDNAVELYFDNSLKLSTAAGGVNIGGNLNLNGADSYEIRLGANNDLKLYHDGTESWVDTSTGDLILRSTADDVILRGSDDVIIQTDGSDNAIICNNNGSVDLHYNTSKKLETTTTGAKVTGALEVTQEYPSIRPILDLNFAATKTLDRRITFSRRGTATYTAENGLIKYAATNEPRFDHNPITGESLGLLIEEGRTNLINYSSEINLWTTADANVTANVVTAPDGTLTADKVALSGTSGYALRSLTIPANNIHTYSVYMKKADNDFGMLRYRWNGSNYDTVNFDLANGTTSRVPSGVSSTSIINVGNGWYRCIVTFTPTSTATSNFQIRSSSEAQTGSSSSYTGTIDGTRGVYAWGAQVEAGAFATSYIPTSGSSLTRENEFATITGTNFTDFYNDTEGSLYSDFSLIGLDSAYNSTTVMLTNNTTTNYLAIFGHNPVIAYAITGGSVQFNATLGGSSTTGVNYRAAMAYKLNDFAASLNGGTVSTDTSATIPPVDRMLIGRRTTLNKLMTGYIRAIKYYNKRLPNVQLQGLTAQ